MGEGVLPNACKGDWGFGFAYARILALKRPSILGCFDGRFILLLVSLSHPEIPIGSPGQVGKF